MSAAGVDYLLTTAPDNIRMLCGYWPVTGASALLFGETKSVLVIPKDEEHLAASAEVSEIRPYVASTLDGLETPSSRILTELRSLDETLSPGVIAIDSTDRIIPLTYLARYSISLSQRSVEIAFPDSQVIDGSKMFAQHRSILVDSEIEVLQSAIASARHGFDELSKMLEPETTESELASRLSIYLNAPATGKRRAGGQFFCMSGPNSAGACASFQQSGDRRIAADEVLLIHCNSYLNGLWTDITRTYFTGQKTARFQEINDALLQARDAALAEIRPGASARIVDAAARDSLGKRGLAPYFTHGLGHGVGFSAIDHLAAPILHPKSDHILEEGMVFNVEPAVYFPDQFGMRHCDMVVVTANGAELLTPFS